MSQCSIELQTITSDSQLQTLIRRVAQLENQLNLIEHKLGGNVVTQAVSSQFTSDSTAAACCETNQARTWKPTSFIKMFEDINDRIKRLESPVASTAVLGTVVDENSNVRLQHQDCLTQLESQFNERMANLKTLLEMTASHTTEERNDSSSKSFEPKPEVSLTDQLQTLITIISQDPENSPIDKCELLKGCLDNMAMSTACSTTTTVLSKHDELVEIVDILAASSISDEHYTRLESLVDSVVKRCDKSDECIDNLKKQVKANSEELKRIISKEKELDTECTKFQEMITDKTKKKNSKTQRVFDSQLFVLNAMSNECKTYKTDLHKLSTAISKELRENLFQIINAYLTAELELQLNILNDSGANSLTQQPSVSVPETTVVISKLSKIKCVLVGGSRTGKCIICESFVNRKTAINTLPTMFDHYSTERVVDGVRYNLELWDTSGCENCERFRKRIYDNTDVFLIWFSIYERKYLSDVTSDWIPEVRSLCPKAGIVLVGAATNSENKRNIAFDIDEGMLLAKQYHASSYVECSLSMEDIDAVFAAAVKAAVKARRR